LAGLIFTFIGILAFYYFKRSATKSS